MNNLFLLLEEQTAPQQGSWLPLILMLGIIVVMFFITGRSQKKQQKQIDDMRNNLQIGDEITTIGGIIGKIVSIKDETCIIETGRDGVRMRILKSAVRCVDVPARAMNYTINVEDKNTKEDYYDDSAAAENSENEGKKKNKKK